MSPLRAFLAALAASFALCGGAAAAQESPRVVAALSQTTISITSGFHGSEILVYGAITGGAETEEFGVVVAITGPSFPVVVRKKGRMYGVWTNVEEAQIDSAPSFYAVATTGPFYQTISHTEDFRHRISLETATRFVGARADLSRREDFLDAIVRLRKRSGRYVVNPGGVDVIEGSLFRATFSLPDNIVEGAYRARVFLTREREVLDIHESEIAVGKAGLERRIYDLAQESPLLYGVLSILVAAFAGFAASEAFRYMRG